MTSLPWPVIGPAAGWAAFLVLAFLVLRAVVKGELVPKSTHEREVNAAEHDANEWRTEGRIKDQQVAELNVQLGHMREVGKTVDAIMRSIGHNARSSDRTSRGEDP